MAITGRIVSLKQGHWTQGEDGTLMADRRWYRHIENRNVYIEPGTELDIRINHAVGRVRTRERIMPDSGDDDGE